MITHKMLASWRQGVTLAISSLTIDPEITIAMQEMYIEAKALRRQNLRLLNSETLIDKLAEYVRLSTNNHYISPDLEDLIDDIDETARDMNINLEIKL